MTPSDERNEAHDEEEDPEGDEDPEGEHRDQRLWLAAVQLAAHRIPGTGPSEFLNVDTRSETDGPHDLSLHLNSRFPSQREGDLGVAELRIAVHRDVALAEVDLVSVESES